jgi:hypothetical protein
MRPQRKGDHDASELVPQSLDDGVPERGADGSPPVKTMVGLVPPVSV